MIWKIDSEVMGMEELNELERKVLEIFRQIERTVDVSKIGRIEITVFLEPIEVVIREIKESNWSGKVSISFPTKEEGEIIIHEE